MRITRLRTNEGKKLNAGQLQELRNALDSAIAADHFITYVSIINGSRIDTGMHMKSFTVNTDILGKNGRVYTYSARHSVKGYVRTNLPTWEQREQHNHTINGVLDRFEYKANIKSGPYDIRKFNTGAITYWGSHDGSVYTEKECREMCDSDRLEFEHKEAKLKAKREEKVSNEAKRWLK